MPASPQLSLYWQQMKWRPLHLQINFITYVTILLDSPYTGRWPVTSLSWLFCPHLSWRLSPKPFIVLTYFCLSSSCISSAYTRAHKFKVALWGTQTHGYCWGQRRCSSGLPTRCRCWGWKVAAAGTYCNTRVSWWWEADGGNTILGHIQPSDVY